MADKMSGKVLQACDATHPGAVSLGNQTLGSGTKTVDALTSSQFLGLSSDPSAAVSPSGGVRWRSNSGVPEVSANGAPYVPVPEMPSTVPGLVVIASGASKWERFSFEGPYSAANDCLFVSGAEQFEAPCGCLLSNEDATVIGTVGPVNTGLVPIRTATSDPVVLTSDPPIRSSTRGPWAISNGGPCVLLNLGPGSVTFNASSYLVLKGSSLTLAPLDSLTGVFYTEYYDPNGGVFYEVGRSVA
jgi:hypothetical protein